MNININKSYLLIAVVSTAHLGGIVILLTLPLAWWILTTATALVLVSLIRLRRRGVLSAQGWWRIREDGTCLGLATAADAEPVTWRIIEAIRYPGWVCLQLKSRGRRARTLLVLRDAVDAQLYRELCARIEQRRLPVIDQSPV